MDVFVVFEKDVTRQKKRTDVEVIMTMTVVILYGWGTSLECSTRDKLSINNKIGRGEGMGSGYRTKEEVEKGIVGEAPRIKYS